MFDTRGNGGPNHQWETVTLYLYNTGWVDFDFGRAAAVAWILFIIIVAFGLLNFFITQRFIAGDAGVKSKKKVKK